MRVSYARGGLVLKHSGTPQNIRRLNKMRLAREVCEKMGYTHLVVPRARLYKDFIVESRLPIILHNAKAQIDLYLENKEQFTTAIKV